MSGTIRVSQLLSLMLVLGSAALLILRTAKYRKT